MTFLIPCPNCGRREALEFSFGGESSKRPEPGSPDEDLAGYLYFRTNSAGRQVEWWFHRDGCRRWFLAVRDTVTNEFETTYWPNQRERSPA